MISGDPTKNLSSRRGSKLFLEGLVSIAVLPLLIAVCVGGELTESESFFNFIRAIDTQNVLRVGWNGPLPHPCSHKYWKSSSIKCNLQATAITEIRLENLNLSGRIDAESLCKLKTLQVLSLANNLIQGSIPNSISNCARLTYMNLSSNLLSGGVPLSLTKLKYLRRLDISNNHFTGFDIPHFKHKIKYSYAISAEVSQVNNTNMAPGASPTGNESDHGANNWYKTWTTFIPLVIGICILFLFIYFIGKKASQLAKEREILKALQDSPSRTPPVLLTIEKAKPDDRRSELEFFVDEDERFKLDDLLEATADLQCQSVCSSLYKVILKNGPTYAVKRLRNSQVSFEEFGKTMRHIGNLKHPNILPLVGYNNTNEEKLLFYKYQSNGSLLDLLENYIFGKRDFPWRLRLSIARGIARGLDFLYQSCNYQEIIPHGNLKLSNILLDENENPVISEYGLTKFIDIKKCNLFKSNAYTAPEKTLSEQADVFSFGIILLELLTGKTVERSGIDLPKWVRAMVREEWTGEVFDKEVIKAGRQWAFPLLNVSLKCVAHSPDDRPTMAEVLEKIEEVANAGEDHDFHDHSISSLSSMESCQQDNCLLHTVIPETWDTPGSNY